MAKRTIRNIPPERAEMPTQDPGVRAHNFDEVALGFELDNALLEAERCLFCPKPKCVAACPVNIDIPAFIGRISEKELNTIDVSNYRGTTHIGKTGLEKYYEEELHGIVGQQNVEVNAEGRILRVIDKIPPLPGNNLVLNLDMELQRTAEQALGDFAGAVIVMQPKTGAVLAFVSEPVYDPNLFVHGISVKDYNELREGDYKPLFNRALFGQYPPGSTFKTVVATAAPVTPISGNGPSPKIRQGSSTMLSSVRTENVLRTSLTSASFRVMVIGSP